MHYSVLLALLSLSRGFEATVKSNYDGDTVTVDLVDPAGCIPAVFAKDLPIRVRGIDSPEIRGGSCMLEKCLAKKAKLFTQESLRGASVKFEREARDKYFRVLADVMFRRQGETQYRNLTREIIKVKLAVPYFGDTKVADWCDFTDQSFYWSYTQECMREDPCVAIEVDTGSALTTSECRELLR